MADAEKKELCEEVETALSLQRHDFINHIQVIHAYLQIGKIEKATLYLENLVSILHEKNIVPERCKTGECMNRANREKRD